VEASISFPWRQLGTLLVDEQLLTPDELEQALDEQRRTGRLLGQILVERGYVSAYSLARVLSEQHGVHLGPADEPQHEVAAEPTTTPEGPWRPLGKVLVEHGFVTQAELDEALADQHADRRLGEILVERGALSGPALARALAEQHGIDLGWLSERGTELETAIEPHRAEEPVYRVYAVTHRQGFQERTCLSDSANFLEAADFAMEFVQEHEPEALEIERSQGDDRETVWTYSETRAAAANAARKDLVETFGFDPTIWGSS